MMRAQYHEYLQSPHWQQVRRDKLYEQDYLCEKCGRGNIRLEIHHLHYRSLGAEKLGDLACLCRDCHQAEHDKEAKRLSWTELVERLVRNRRGES